MLYLVAAPDWGTAEYVETTMNGERFWIPKRDQDVFDSMLFVIDPHTGAVLARQRFEDAFCAVIPGGHLLQTWQDDSGSWQGSVRQGSLRKSIHTKGGRK